jgi:hypothetical protein
MNKEAREALRRGGMVNSFFLFENHRRKENLAIWLKCIPDFAQANSVGGIML